MSTRHFKRIWGLGMVIMLGMEMGILGEDKREALMEKLYNYPEKATLEELFEVSDCVVMGRVKKVKAKKEIELLPIEIVKEKLMMEEKFTKEERMHLLEERRRIEMIYTYINLSSEEWFKGFSKEKEVLIQVGGGKVENFGVFVNYIGGTPQFKEREKILVFLKKVKDKPYYQVILGARGKYVVEKDKIYNCFGNKISLKDFLEEIRRIKNEKSKEVEK